MSHNIQFLPAAELDFATVKQNLKTFLSQCDKFKDVDFDGSNIGVLLDLLSYNTMMNGYYLNQVGSEMFLDTALRRDSIVSHAKELNYIPLSGTGAMAVVDITITPSGTPSSITIPKNYAFQTTIDNSRLNFIVPQNVVVTNTGSGYIASGIEIFEGRIVEERFDVVSSQNVNNITEYSSIFVLESENVDISSIEVQVFGSINDTSPVTMTKADSLFGLDSTSNVYFINGYSSNKYQITFGNGVLGRHLSTGNIVKITYRDTSGSLGNGSYLFTKTDAIEGETAISVNTINTASGGNDRETENQIKYNAVKHFQTQERGVTAKDFITLLKNKFPEVQSVIAYGGEEIQQYGKIIISVKPFGALAVATTSLKNQITDYLKLKSITTEPVVVDPSYFYVGINSKVYYNPSLLTTNENDVKNSVVLAINDYNINELNDFGNDFLYSRIINDIDVSDNTILSNDTDVTMIYRWSPTVNISNTLSFSFSNNIKSSTLIPYVYTSNFTYDNGGVDTTVNIHDDGLGILNMYTIDNNNKEVIVLPSIGTIDYNTGDIIITTIVKSYTSYISIYSVLVNKDIVVNQNQFLIIDGSDINIEMIPFNV